jgi:hypothetical protein
LILRDMFVASISVFGWMPFFERMYLNFPHAPPHIDGAPRYPQRPKPPFQGAEPWQCSVYYYWWEYLRRSEPYKNAINQTNKGKFEKVVKDFGDVHAADFLDWWHKHLFLFTFHDSGSVIFGSAPEKNDPYYMSAHLLVAGTKSEMVRRFKEEFERQVNEGKLDLRRQLRDSICYPVASRPVLQSLHTHLKIWDARLDNPDAADHELFDLAGLEIWDQRALERDISDLKTDGLYYTDLEKALKRKKQLAAQRHLRIAAQYIENVALGEFPKRSTR